MAGTCRRRLSRGSCCWRTSRGGLTSMASRRWHYVSAAHEEYHEARGRKPVLVFVQTGVPREPGEEKLVEEVSGWEGGQYREPFDSPTSLRAVVTGALHRWALSQQAGPVNEAEL